MTFSAGSPDVQFLGKGWSQPEDWGVWSDGQVAEIQLLTGSLSNEMFFNGTAHAFFPPGCDQKLVGIAINGIAITHVRFEKGLSCQNFSFKVPPETLLRNGKILITFTVCAPCAPNDAGFSSTDPRKLGIGLHSLSIIDTGGFTSVDWKSINLNGCLDALRAECDALRVEHGAMRSYVNSSTLVIKSNSKVIKKNAKTINGYKDKLKKMQSQLDRWNRRSWFKRAFHKLRFKK